MGTENSKKSVKHSTEHLKEHQWKPGVSGNPGGRPRNVMKDFMRDEFKRMTDTEKRKFLRMVPNLDQIKLAEGNPHQTNDLTSGDLPIPILAGKPDKKSDA